MDIRADLARNRLYIVLDGFFQDDELTKAADTCISEGAKLKQGFDIINDISNFKPASPKGAEEIKRAGIYVKQNGVRRVIRVVGEAVLAQAQFDRQAKGAGYNADTAATIADAERMLDGK
jgi:hypothetical protein